MTENDLRMGMRVFANREFSGVPVGTEGEIVPASNSWPEPQRFGSVAVKWNRPGKHELTDWFSFDDLQYLDMAEEGEDNGQATDRN